MARYLSTPRELWAINSRQEKVSCDIPLDYQAKAFEKQDYIVLGPSQSQAFKLAICFSPFPTLKPGTYRMLQCYRGSDYYYEGSVRKKVEYPWEGTLVSDPLVIEVVSKGNRPFSLPAQR